MLHEINPSLGEPRFNVLNLTSVPPKCYLQSSKARSLYLAALKNVTKAQVSECNCRELALNSGRTGAGLITSH